MKKFFTLIISTFTFCAFSQQNYCDFEGTKAIAFGEYNGVLDSMRVNPMPNAVNSSSFCGQYIRSAVMYDNFKLFTYSKLTDVTPYASPSATNFITMKLYSSAPVGTPINLQLGAKTVTTYPAGVHSIYTTTTSVQNAWETLTFKYVSNPSGATVQPTDVDKIVILFDPLSTTTHTIYFDDPTGPVATVIGLNENALQNTSATLYQSYPNPANANTTIKYSLKEEMFATLNLFDICGKKIKTIIDGKLTPGDHSATIETENMSSGIYFYQLTANGVSTTRKLIIAH